MVIHPVIDKALLHLIDMIDIAADALHAWGRQLSVNTEVSTVY